MAEICVNDRSDKKLYFAADFLWALKPLAVDVCLKSAADYRPFLEHFEHIHLGSRSADDKKSCMVEIVDSLDGIKDGVFTFPIITKEITASYNQLRGDKTGQFRLPPLKKSHGDLVCGDESWLTDILLREIGSKDLTGKRFLISAGPTRERFDPVRFLTNRSTGKMGIALARAAYIRGANVTLVLGPTCEYAPDYLNIINIESAAEMASVIKENFEWSDVYIGAAAIADFTPKTILPDKIKKKDGEFQPRFRRTTDVIASLNDIRKRQLLVGFSVETANLYDNSLAKLQKKGLDLIIANNPNEKGAAFGGDTNKVSIIRKDGGINPLPLISKFELSNIVLDEIIALLH
jgi:phosphopantothenoylcysteine decarboxylase/phosphopantothenate--cysteine ligase